MLGVRCLYRLIVMCYFPFVGSVYCVLVRTCVVLIVECC